MRKPLKIKPQSELQDEIDRITATYLFHHQDFINVAVEKDAALKNKPREAVDQMLAFYPGVIAVAVHEKAHELNAKGGVANIVMAEQLARAAQARTGIDIHPGTTIGENLFIDHGTATVIGETAVIGNNTQIMQKVTIGAFTNPKETRLDRLAHRHPEIGNDCFLSDGVEMLGNVKVGNGVTVGPQVVFFGNNIVIGDGVKIGPGVKIYDGCTIPANVTIGAGAFIHQGSGEIDEKTIPPHSEVFRSEDGKLKIIDAAPNRYKETGENGRSNGSKDETYMTI